MKNKYYKSNQYKANYNDKKPYLSGKQSVFNTLKSLFSNQAVIDGRRKPPFFIAILVILFTFISWIAPLSLGYTTKSASFLANIDNNGIDHGIKMAFNRDYFEEISIVGEEKERHFSYDVEHLDEHSNKSEKAVTDEIIDFPEGQLLSLAKGTFVDSKENKKDYSEKTGQVIYPNSTSITSFTDKEYSFYVDSVRTNKNDVIDNTFTATEGAMTDYVVYLEVYIIPELSAYSDEFTLFQSNFLTTVIYNVNDEGQPQKYPHSVLLLCKDAIRIISFPIAKVVKTNSATTNYFGYTSSAFKNVNSQSFKKYLYSKETTDNGAFDLFVHTLNEAAAIINIRQAWVYIGIMSGVAIGTMAVVSLLIFLMERRKTSVVQSNLYEAFVQGITLCSTPALLSLLGFMSFPFGIIGFAGFALMRVLFMGSKISPVTNNANSKPLYKAKAN